MSSPQSQISYKAKSSTKEYVEDVCNFIKVTDKQREQLRAVPIASLDASFTSPKTGTGGKATANKTGASSRRTTGAANDSKSATAATRNKYPTGMSHYLDGRNRRRGSAGSSSSKSRRGSDNDDDEYSPVYVPEAFRMTREEKMGDQN